MQKCQRVFQVALSLCRADLLATIDCKHAENTADGPCERNMHPKGKGGGDTCISLVKKKAHRPPRVAGSVLFGLCTRDDDFTCVNNNIVYKYLCINGLCTSKPAKGCG